MLQPLGKRIIVEPIIPERKQTVIIMKDDSPQTFKVLAIGDEVTKVNINDEIFLASHSTSELKFKGITYTLTHQDNVIAKRAV